jgi:hypothetical protein
MIVISFKVNVLQNLVNVGESVKIRNASQAFTPEM